jgi:hypothetical protein
MELTAIQDGNSASSDSAALVTLSSSAVTIAHVAAEPVLRRDIHRTIRVAGIMEALETRTAVVAAPAGGRVDFIAVDHPGMEIQQGETLVRLFSPDLAQRSRFLRVAISNQPAATTLTGNAPFAARVGRHNATSLPGMTNESPARVVGGYPLELFVSDLTAPISGIVSERSVSLGQYVMEGQRIATVIDPSVLWFRFDASERQLRSIAPGQRVRILVNSAPERTWVGTVSFVEPVNDEAGRIAKVRAVITNSFDCAIAGSLVPLRPGMFAEGLITVAFPSVLAVPKAAVVYPGSSAWVYVEHGTGRYERRRICLGREGDKEWEVLSGLEEDERVVTTGNVLVDAQATFANGDEVYSAGTDTAVKPEDGGASLNRFTAGDAESHSPSEAGVGHLE